MLQHLRDPVQFPSSGILALLWSDSGLLPQLCLLCQNYSPVIETCRSTLLATHSCFWVTTVVSTLGVPLPWLFVSKCHLLSEWHLKHSFLHDMVPVSYSNRCSFVLSVLYCFIWISHSLLDSELCVGNATSFHSKNLVFIPRISDVHKTSLVRIGFECSRRCSLSEEHHKNQGMDVFVMLMINTLVL